MYSHLTSYDPGTAPTLWWCSRQPGSRRRDAGPQGRLPLSLLCLFATKHMQLPIWESSSRGHRTLVPLQPFPVGKHSSTSDLDSICHCSMLCLCRPYRKRRQQSPRSCTMHRKEVGRPFLAAGTSSGAEITNQPHTNSTFTTQGCLRACYPDQPLCTKLVPLAVLMPETTHDHRVGARG